MWNFNDAFIGHKIGKKRNWLVFDYTLQLPMHFSEKKLYIEMYVWTEKLFI